MSRRLRESRRRGVRRLEHLEDKMLLAGDLIGHWRADDLNGSFADQDIMTNWLDDVASIDATSIGQPKLIKDAIGGRSVVRFSAEDGSDGFFVDRSVNPMGNRGDYTVVVAFATDSSNLQGSDGHWYENSSLVDGNRRGFGGDWGLSINTNGQLATGLGGDFRQNQQTIHSSRQGLNDGELHVAVVTRRQGNLDLFVDNARVAETTTADALNRSRIEMTIGATADGDNGYSGDIAEVRVYDGQLSEAELGVVYAEIDGYYHNTLPEAKDDAYTFAEDVTSFGGYVPPAQGVLANDLDADGDKLTAKLVEGVQHGTLKFLPDGSFFYTPTRDFFGTDSFTYSAHDFRPSDTSTVSITVLPKYDSPIAVSDVYKMLSAAVLDVSAADGLLANDLNPDLVELHVELAESVSGGALQLRPDGGFVYDPQGFSGRAQFGYRILDGTGQSDLQVVTLIVNTPPIAYDDTYVLNEDEPLQADASVGVLSNDFDADGNVPLAALVDEPLHGTVAFAADGSFVYSPAADYFGDDQFSYQLADAEDPSNVAVVGLTIRPINDAPSPKDDTLFTKVNRELTVTAANGVLINDRDTEQDGFSARLERDVQQGQLEFHADGSFTYMPPADFSGIVTFDYRADDGRDVSESATVRIAVNSVEQQRRIVINELHVDPDVKTEWVEFVELYNASDVPVDLSGWKLRNAVDYEFPAGSWIEAQGFVVVSQDPEMFGNKFGRPAWGPWNGKLSNTGETLELWNATSESIDQVDYQLGFPWPTTGEAPGPSLQLVHPGLANDLGGNWRSALPTPGEINSVHATNAAPAMRQVGHDPQQPSSNQPVTVTARVTDPQGVARVILEYQLVEPGDYISESDPRYLTEWTTVSMADTGQAGDAQAGDGIYTVVLPADLQAHRRLVRYRITATDGDGVARTAPYDDDPQPNFAYFVYDQLPSWTGAAQPGVTPEVTYSSELLQTVPVYHLITTHANHVDAQYIPDSQQRFGYGGSDYLWEGTLVYDGQVYDHVNFRARGGVWRYAMGKNMWKFSFERGHSFQARDENGDPYGVPWDKLNFSSIIQQGNYLHRGEQGLFESVGFELFNLAGTESPETHYVHFRIISSENELGADQYSGDFQGLYLAIEQPDGNFLDQHDMPDGNFYKIESNTAESTVNQSATQVGDRSDVRDFIKAFRGLVRPDVEWWQQNLDLERYYGYQAISQAIHHYDTAFGKNFYYFHNPETDKWEIHPWDLDLTWADNMYGDENHEFNVKVAKNPAFNDYTYQANIDLDNKLNADYQNVVREIMDLLYNPEQTGMLIDQMAAIVYQPGETSLVDADRAMWDYNPINAVASKYTDNDKNATKYHFYDVVPSHDFAGMIQLMKDYVVSRSRWMESRLLTNEANIPATPVIRYTGGDDFPLHDLTFATSEFSSPIGTQFAGLKWRIAEVTDPSATGFDAYDRGTERSYEIDATWESDVMTSFEPTAAVPGHLLEAGKTYRVRVRMLDDDNHWSHWSEPIQFVAASGVSQDLASGLRISEVNYNPYAPNVAEISAGFTDSDDFEFIELVNISSQAIDLAGAQLQRVQIDGAEQGVDFQFAEGEILQLAPGKRLVVVEDIDAFRQRYGDYVPVAGEWSGKLSNRAETITLTAFGSIIQQFAYDDQWHSASDGVGSTLEVVDVTQADLNRWSQSTGWQASAARGGTPGRDSTPDLPGDSNRDGLFDSNDLIFALQSAEFEDDIAGNSTWEEGDWNGDGDFTVADLEYVLAFGLYEVTPAPVSSRPLTAVALPSDSSPVTDHIFGEVQSPLSPELVNHDGMKSRKRDAVLLDSVVPSLFE